MSEIDIWDDFKSAYSSASNLIDVLEAEGKEKDGNVDPPAWASLADPIQVIFKKMARAIDYECGTDLDAEDIQRKLGGELGEKFAEAYKRAVPLCESPIERLILPWLISQDYPGFNHNPAVLRPGESHLYVPFTVAVIPQLPIGRYRADFALASSRKDGKVRFVIVECDGAAFHDGVSNVVKDVDRDVKLLSNDRVLDVIRIEGKEIRRDPQAAAAIAAKAVYWAWSTKNKDTAHKFAASGA